MKPTCTTLAHISQYKEMADCIKKYEHNKETKVKKLENQHSSNLSVKIVNSMITLSSFKTKKKKRFKPRYTG